MFGGCLTKKVMERPLHKMNEHIPAKRKSLTDMLDETESFYEGKDGQKNKVSKDELKKVAVVGDPWDLNRIKIPILLMTDTSYGDGYWKVIGKAETRLISAAQRPEKAFTHL
jgi:uncharacterized protein (UPF0216 family)